MLEPRLRLGQERLSTPRLAAGPPVLSSNQWATLTGGQRDDDDGYGKKCEWNFAANYPGGGSWVCNVFDMAASPSPPSISADNCGYCDVSLPCAVLDLDEDLSVENNWPEDDYNAVPQGSDVATGPRCETCPLTCEEGAGGNCP